MQETWYGKAVHILYTYPVLEKIRMQTLSLARIDLDQIEDAGLSSVVALSKGVRLLKSPI